MLNWLLHNIIYESKQRLKNLTNQLKKLPFLVWYKSLWSNFFYFFYFLPKIKLKTFSSNEKAALLIGLVGRVFANDPGDLSLIPGRVIPKTLKMVLDTSFLNTRQYKVRIKGKVEQFWERSSALPLHLGVVAIEKGAFWSYSIKGRQLYLLYLLKTRSEDDRGYCIFKLLCFA